MTYAESTRSAVVYSSIVPPPRTPVGPSMLKNVRKSALQPPIKNGINSLEYWSKSEDENSGITCYYSRHNIQYPSQRQGCWMKQTMHSPHMNGFLPSTSTTTLAGQNDVAVRYPPFPHATPPPESVMSPPVGIHRNVPAMPRAKLLEKSIGKNRADDNRNLNQKNVVWGGNSGRRDDEGATSAVTPLNPFSASEKIQSSQRTNNKGNNNNNNSVQNGRPSTPTNSAPLIQLITQVHRDGTVTGVPSMGQNEQPIGGGDALTPYEKTANDSVGSINEKPLLSPVLPQDANKKCLVIDLDETLVHSSFKAVKNPDFVIPVEIDGVEHQVYVLKRPYVDEFLAKVGELFECILFTASLAKYGDPVVDLLDKNKVFRGRLFREACVLHKGNYIKDLSRLGRNLNQTLIIDNSRLSYAFHPENAVPVTSWFDNPADTELLDILPALEHLNGFSSIYDLYRPEEGPKSELLNHCSC